MISILTFINGKLRRATVMLSHLGRHQSLLESSIANLLCLPNPTPLRLILHKSLFSNHINYIIQKEAKNHQLLTDSTGPNLVLSGYRNSTSMNGQGAGGYYRSSTASSSAQAYALYLYGSGAVLPADHSPKYYAFSLRCLARDKKKGGAATFFHRVDSTHTIYQLLTDSTGPNLVLGGRRSSTGMYGQGTYGHYWSSTAYSSATYAYTLRLDNSGAVSPANNSLKYYGFSLRCLAAALIRSVKININPS